MTTTTVLAWHSNPDLKDEVLARLRAHRAADAIVQGRYQQYAPHLAVGYRGCAIGCTLPLQDLTGLVGDDVRDPECGWHAEVERLYGIPQSVGHLIDRTFEGLPLEEAGDFAVTVVQAVPVGADLSLVSSRLLLDVLTDEDAGVLPRTPPGSPLRAAVEGVAGLYRRRLAGGEPARRDWKAALRAAWQTETAISDGASVAAYAAMNALRAAELGDHSDAGHAVGSAVIGDRRWVAGRLIHHIRATGDQPATAGT